MLALSRKSLIVLLSAALIQMPSTSLSGQTITPITDDAAYAVYAAALGLEPSNSALLIQQETQSSSFLCERRQFLADPQWTLVLQNFEKENTRPRLLTPMLTILGGSYRFVSRAAVEANTRAALEYARRQRTPPPESLVYTTVSAIGFNPSRTKALVAIDHLRTSFSRNGSGVWRALELREGKWEPSPVLGCDWIG